MKREFHYFRNVESEERESVSATLEKERRTNFTGCYSATGGSQTASTSRQNTATLQDTGLMLLMSRKSTQI